jgi:hypothetical protein
MRRSSPLLMMILMPSVLVLGAVPASAEQGPVGSCSTGRLITVPEVLLTIAPPGSEESVRAGDRNGDGYVCIQGGGSTFAVQDNNG